MGDGGLSSYAGVHRRRLDRDVPLGPARQRLHHDDDAARRRRAHADRRTSSRRGRRYRHAVRLHGRHGAAAAPDGPGARPRTATPASSATASRRSRNVNFTRHLRLRCSRSSSTTAPAGIGGAKADAGGNWSATTTPLADGTYTDHRRDARLAPATRARSRRACRSRSTDRARSAGRASLDPVVGHTAGRRQHDDAVDPCRHGNGRRRHRDGRRLQRRGPGRHRDARRLACLALHAPDAQRPARTRSRRRRATPPTTLGALDRALPDDRNGGRRQRPGAPTLNSATAGNGSVALAWSAPASDGGSAITGYKVYRGTLERRRDAARRRSATSRLDRHDRRPTARPTTTRSAP